MTNVNSSSLKIALISTPRSGNTWVRRVLAETLSLSEVAVHLPGEIPAILPERLILQIHWDRELSFEKWLKEHDFKVLVLARHPLDVLVSVLHFVKTDPYTARWVNGGVKLPPTLGLADPTEPIFRDYCLGAGAKVLLGVSRDWWGRGDVRAKYEDLVHSPEKRFSELIREFGGSTEKLPAALEKYSLAAFQALPNRHGWQGRSGLWKLLITPLLALRIYMRHRSTFKTLGYRLAPSVLSAAEARRNWQLLR